MTPSGTNNYRKARVGWIRALGLPACAYTKCTYRVCLDLNAHPHSQTGAAAPLVASSSREGLAAGHLNAQPLQQHSLPAMHAGVPNVDTLSMANTIMAQVSAGYQVPSLHVILGFSTQLYADTVSSQLYVSEMHARGDTRYSNASTRAMMMQCCWNEWFNFWYRMDERIHIHMTALQSPTPQPPPSAMALLPQQPRIQLNQHLNPHMRPVLQRQAPPPQQPQPQLPPQPRPPQQPQPSPPPQLPQQPKPPPQQQRQPTTPQAVGAVPPQPLLRDQLRHMVDSCDQFLQRTAAQQEHAEWRENCGIADRRSVLGKMCVSLPLCLYV